MGATDRSRWLECLGLPWRAVVAALLVTVAVTWQDAPGQPKEEPSTLKDFFVSEGKKVPITVYLDRIAVVAKESADREAVTRAVREPGWTMLEQYPGPVYVYRLDKPRAEAEMVNLARSTKAREPRQFRQVGLVVMAERAQVPMILTDEFVVQFKASAAGGEIEKLTRRKGIEVVRTNPFMKTQFLLRVTEGAARGTLDFCRQLQEDSSVEYAHPNFVQIVEPRQIIPNDPLFGNQWHHQNTGQGGGTVDADIDTPLAWQLSTGGSDIVIAVIDGGFDAGHPDLVPNLWVNPGEKPGNNVDDDNNGFGDDVNGWDFADGDGTLAGGGTHGTCVAGCVGARGDNKEGVSGTCPNCRLMLLRASLAPSAFDTGLAFDYARAMGAHVITNSWGFPIGTPTTTNVVNAINNAAANGRGGLGCVIFFAMNNSHVNDCTGPNPDISSLPSVIAVSRATNRDRWDRSGFGNCMDVLGPTRAENRGFGTLGITTTTGRGQGTDPTKNYTFNFSGTSAATPITAGIAGLVLHLRPNLARLQVQRLLQDTADRVEDSAGAYGAVNGFSAPAGGNATHGYGRVNAFEAVRVAAPAERGGRGGVDVFLRDNRLDWGNTEQPSNTLFEPVRGFIAHWESVDIKVDAPPYQTAPATAAAFESLADENPMALKVNRVYVRVRNRGPVTATKVIAKLHWAFAGTALPALPADFWVQFPSDSSDTSHWHPLGRKMIKELPYCGSSVAGASADPAAIVAFDWPAPAIDPAQKEPHHYCLLAIVDSPRDPVSPQSKATSVVDDITPWDNNVAHRNVFLEDSALGSSLEEQFYVRNPHSQPIRAVLRLAKPEKWEVTLDRPGFDKPFPLKEGEEMLVTLRVQTPEPRAKGEVRITQERLGVDKDKAMGGVTYRFRPFDNPE